MRTAQEMYQYVLKNKYTDNVGKVRGKKHFKSLEEELNSDEKVYMALVALLNSDNVDSGYFAVAITDSRILMAQKGFLGRNKVKTVLLNNLNDISVVQKLSMRHIEIDTIKDRVVLSLNTWSNKSVGSKLKDIVLKLKQEESYTGKIVSTADEIRRYKELLNDGIITEKEFEEKKKELL